MPPTNDPPARYLRAQQMDTVLGADRELSGSVGAGTSRCENDACPTGCPAVGLVVYLSDRWIKLIYPPATAREIAFDLLAAADANDPAGAVARRAS